MIAYITPMVSIIFFLMKGGLTDVVTGPSDAVVLLNVTHELKCVVANGDFPTWEEQSADGSVVRLYTVNNRFSADEKYRNFFISGQLPDYNLRIEDIQIEDVGVYQCATTDSDISSANLSVEVPPSSVIITCNPSTNCPSPNAEVTSTVECSCRAFGAYPQTLQMRWIGAEPDTTEPSTTPSSMGPNGSFDFTQNATGSITGPSGSVQCTLEGYVNTIDEADRIAIYDYSSPTCVLEAEYDTTCSGSTANLTCSCTGSSPEVNSYVFFDEAGSILNGTVQGNVMLNVAIEPDTGSKFYCRGCNGVNFGEQSLSEVTICRPATSTKQPTEAPKSTDPNPTEKNTALIIGLSFAGVILVVVLGGGGGYLYYSKRVPPPDPNKEPDPQPAPRNPPSNKDPEKVELQYADIDHGSRAPSNQIHQPSEATEYATVQSVIV